MQVAIKKDTNGHGANGDHASRLDISEKGSLSPTKLLRNLEGSSRELREALLQILSGVTPYIPRVEVNESRDAIHVSVALPGIDESSLNVAFDGRLLRIKGEKTEKRERVRRKYRSVEKVYRTFERAIPIFADVDQNAAVATLRKDVLRINVPRTVAASAPTKQVRIVTEPSASAD